MLVDFFLDLIIFMSDLYTVQLWLKELNVLKYV